MSYGQAAAGGSPTKKKRHKDDFYATRDRDATEAIVPLLRAHFPNVLWENACGEGHMSKVLIDHGFDVVSTDKVDRGYGSVQDFLSTTEALAPAIVTNPPFNLAAEFIQHALFTLGVDYLALYLKATFYHADERFALFEEFKPARICPLTFRVDFSGEGRPTMETSWYLWAPTLQPVGLYQPIRRLNPKPRGRRK